MNDIKIIKKNNGIEYSYNPEYRIYINSKNSSKGSQIFDSFDVYFSGNIPNFIKDATEKGIKNLINATGLYSNKINHYNLSEQETKNFIYKIGIQKIDKLGGIHEFNGDILANFLSGYGHKKKAYQIMVGDFNLNGLNGCALDKAVIINNYAQDFIHEFLVSHELGHIFNAVKRDRKNISNELGLHCNNIQENKIIPCAMRQDLTQKHLETLSKVGGIYCSDCVKYMKECIKD